VTRSLLEMADAAVAVIGLAGRYPGASSIEDFFSLLVEGREGTTFLSDEEMQEAGVPESLRQDPRWVAAASEIDDPEAFDAPFFGLSPREARMTDPQHRAFLIPSPASWASTRTFSPPEWRTSSASAARL
jgi:phthiocerol/phenolphthiocerol synthesis type-I polyketide synthase E